MKCQSFACLRKLVCGGFRKYGFITRGVWNFMEESET
uniref:Uncharacterized protein n=1 Tax=Vitis vinifera TaxID=29760 RepID=F6I7C0_VITVI